MVVVVVSSLDPLALQIFLNVHPQKENYSFIESM